MSELPNKVIQMCMGSRHLSPDKVLDALEAAVVARVCPYPLPGEAWRFSCADGIYRATLELIVSDHHRVAPEAKRLEAAAGRTKEELLSKVLRKHENASAWLERQTKATEKRIREATVAEETTVSGRARRALRKFCVGLPSKYRYRIAAQVTRDKITDGGAIEALVLDAKAEWAERLERRKAAKAAGVAPAGAGETPVGGGTESAPRVAVRHDPREVNALLAAALLGPDPRLIVRRSPTQFP